MTNIFVTEFTEFSETFRKNSIVPESFHLNVRKLTQTILCDTFSKYVDVRKQFNLKLEQQYLENISK